MKICGFTFIRNAIKYDYPIVEAIRSILPLCDEVVVNLGNSEDETNALVEQIGSPKLRFIHSVWDPALTEAGRVLAVETDKAFDALPTDADWCIYIQADEVIHERYYPAIREAMIKYKDDKRVEGLLFKYVHFYGSYDYVGDSRKWYSREIRIVRRDSAIRSYRDAQGFRKNGKKLKVKLIDAYIYHYGWVKHPEKQLEKHVNFEKFFNNDAVASEAAKKGLSGFDYNGIDSLQLFKGTHPAVMMDRVQRKNWQFEYDISRKRFSLKDKVLYWIEKQTGKRLFEYANYTII